MKEEFPTLLITKETPTQEIKKLTKDNCGGCDHCCKHERAITIPKDIERIAKHLELPEQKFKEEYLDEDERFNTKTHRIRQINNVCVFFNEQERCTLKNKRPLHCQIGNCNEHGTQAMTWFNLNHFVNTKDPQSIREWAVHLKTKPTIPGGELHEIIQDKKKLKEILEYEDLNIKCYP